MGLSSFFKRPAAAASAGGPPDDVQQARTRARQRLIGAVVLLGIGIIGFPLVFETQPRPIPVDIPMEIPRKENAVPLSIPPTAGHPATEPQTTARAAPDDILTEPREPSGNEPSGAAPKSAPRTVPAPARPSASDARAVAGPKPPAADDGARARALLEGGAPAASAPERFVVQVGAFADASAAHDTRLKVEKLGLKTYTQVASTAAGGRIRVRVGPFGTREEADRALAKARGAGLAAVVISL